MFNIEVPSRQNNILTFFSALLFFWSLHNSTPYIGTDDYWWVYFIAWLWQVITALFLVTDFVDLVLCYFSCCLFFWTVVWWRQIIDFVISLSYLSLVNFVLNSVQMCAFSYWFFCPYYCNSGSQLRWAFAFFWQPSIKFLLCCFIV